MIRPAKQPPCFRFGRFEFDVSTSELRKEGSPVKLQTLPARMLYLLLQDPGAVVTRDELQRHLWPDGTFVEFEHGLNTAVKKLRQALEDDADDPTYIQTVPRKGYRFIAKLERSEGAQRPIRHARVVYGTAAALGMAVLFAAVLAPPHAARREAFVGNLTRLTADSGLTWQPAVSPNGDLVAYSSDRGGHGHLDVWVIHRTGGDPIRITDDPADDYDPHFCPDGRIVFRSDRDGGGIYMAPALGGSVVLLARGGRGPQCSPDGRSIAYWTGSLKSFEGSFVSVGAMNGSAPVRIAPELVQARTPVWAPDGKSVLVYGHANKRRHWMDVDWWLAPADGGKARPLGIRKAIQSSLQLGEMAPSFSTWDATSSDVLFSAGEGKADPFALWHAQLWALPVSGSGKVGRTVRKVTTGSGLHNGATTAANGALAFANLELNPDIWTIAVDHKTGRVSGPLRPLMTDRKWQSRPLLSGDESMLLFRTERANGWDFWIRDLRTGVERPLTTSGGAKVCAAMSRDAKTVAFQTGGGVHLADASTGTARLLCERGNLWVTDFIADGSAVLAYDEDDNAYKLVSTAGGGLRHVLRRVNQNPWFAARVSPDGKWIAYFDRGLEVASLDQREVSTSQWRLEDDVQEWLEWSPDGDAIYFLSSRDGPPCLWVARPWSKESAKPVMHFHNRRQALLGNFAVGRRELFLGIHETTGNIWTANLRR